VAVAVSPPRAAVTASPIAPEIAPLVRPIAAASPMLVIAVVMLGNFLGPLYSSVANVAVPNLVAAFGSDVDTIQWVITGYMLGYSVSMPVAGWLADTYGRRSIYLIGLAILTASSVLCACAWDATSLIFFRILQALGAGLIAPTSMAIITDIVPPHERGRALGIWGLGMMLAPSFAPVMSGWIIDNLDDWRIIFAVGVPIGIAGLIFASLFIPRDEDRTRKHAAFDTPGALLLTTSLAALLIPLSQGDRVGWDDPAIVGSFALSALTFAGFVWRELTTPAPMLDLSLFREITFSIAVALRVAMGMGYYLALFLLPLFTQDVMGWPPTLSGLLLVPGGLATAFLMPITGMLSDRIGARPLVFAGMALAAYGTFLFAHLDVTWTAASIALVMIVRNAAMGLLYTPLTSAALSVVPRNRAGSASGIINTVWQVAGSLGIALGQTFLTNRTAVHLSEDAGNVTLASQPVRSGLDAMGAMLAHHGLPVSGAHAMFAQMVAQTAEVQAYGDTFVFSAIILAIATPLALFLVHRPVRPLARATGRR
jgi:EmrB/QacA subfamily drug resistance transporter